MYTHNMTHILGCSIEIHNVHVQLFLKKKCYDDDLIIVYGNYHRLNNDTVDTAPITSTGTISNVNNPHTGHTDTTKLQKILGEFSTHKKVLAHRMPPKMQARVALAVGTGAMECQLVWFSLGWRRIAHAMMMTATPISKKLETSIIL